jgi:uncharacterized lipoprotein YehR (DUF1307 family)
MKRLMVLSFLLALAGCGDGSDSPSAGGGGDTLEQLCKSQLKASDKVCSCIEARAEEELDSEERAFLVANLSGDEVKATELQATLTIEQATQAALFMTAAPAICSQPE